MNIYQNAISLSDKLIDKLNDKYAGEEMKLDKQDHPSYVKIPSDFNWDDSFTFVEVRGFSQFCVNLIVDTGNGNRDLEVPYHLKTSDKLKELLQDTQHNNSYTTYTNYYRELYLSNERLINKLVDTDSMVITKGSLWTFKDYDGTIGRREYLHVTNVYTHPQLLIRVVAGIIIDNINGTTSTITDYPVYLLVDDISNSIQELQ